MLEYVDVGILADAAYEALLYLVAGVVGVVEDAEFAVAALAVQVELAVVAPVEIHAPADEFAYLSGSLLHYFPDSLGVAEVVARYHCVFEMLVEIVDSKIGDRSYTSLRKGRIGLVESGFAYQGHT